MSTGTCCTHKTCWRDSGLVCVVIRQCKKLSVNVEILHNSSNFSGRFVIFGLYTPCCNSWSTCRFWIVYSNGGESKIFASRGELWINFRYGDNPPEHVPPGHLPQGHIPPGHLPPGHLPPGHLPPRTLTPRTLTP